MIKSLSSVLILLPLFLSAQKSKDNTVSTATSTESKAFASVLNGMKFRNIGPAVTSGRIIDLAINPNNKSQWYIAAASSGIWKTDNAGTTFYPVFESQGSYSIGCIKLDPTNPNTVWVGTGENNNQRSVGYGDGIYKSEDGGKTWKNMGLKSSEHIGMIAIDPQDSRIVYVAAYGPLWSAGGDRGIYKTTDGGLNWTRVLNVSENTGFNEIHIDPNHSNILYATAHQRRRHEWTYLGGGPESAIYKSTDFGVTWNKLEGGLPIGDIGRISLAIPPSNTDIVYALIEAAEGNSGLYMSADRGISWSKQSGYSSAGNYYVEIFPDPVNADKIYSMNTWAEVSTDGGRTFKGMGEKSKHVDNHVIWVDEENTKHFLMGCDGGLYETWDAAATWNYKANLPITQFYRVTVDNVSPFYNVYGGTQDNNTLGGPARTKSASGIHNYDWFVTVGGDGFKTVVDTKDPDIVYSQWQYGGLIRFNKKTGEVLDIKPREPKGEPAYRFNWDAPIAISNHDNRTIYFAAQKLFRSKDMGNNWEIISPDLSRGIDRNKIPVMGKVWSLDAVAKNQSTSIYGNITAFAESPKNKDVLIAGTDDGLIQVSVDGGKTWTKTEKFAGVPDRTLVQNVYASEYDEKIFYAVFNNHRNGDFKPYLLKSIDGGKTWMNISGNLPARGSAQCFMEDHIQKNLYFCGTEFGLFVSPDAGKNWSKQTSIPTISVREIVAQKRENDLVIATFGRGIYVLDDYSPLQNFEKTELSMKEKPASIFPIKDGLVFNPSYPLGHRGKSFQGESFYTAENPSIGAVISYYIRDKYMTIKDNRIEREKSQVNDYYPSIDSLRLEKSEEAPYFLMVITDMNGNDVRKMKLPAKDGFARIVWDGRYDKTSPVTFYTPNPDNPYEEEDKGWMAIPGDYQVQIKLVNSKGISNLTEPQNFKLKSLYEMQTDVVFNQSLAEFRRVVLGVGNYCEEMKSRLSYIDRGKSSIASAQILSTIDGLKKSLDSVSIALYGDGLLAGLEHETLQGIYGNIESIVGNMWSVGYSPTGTFKNEFEESKAEFELVYQKVLRIKLVLESLEKELDKIKFPYTPGRLPTFTR